MPFTTFQISPTEIERPLKFRDIVAAVVVAESKVAADFTSSMGENRCSK
jgi:hypothetical protein